MAVVGVGTDICAIARIEAVWRRHGVRFETRLLTPSERAARPVWDAPALARRWACKEAVAKALGTGIGQRIGFQQIVIAHQNGAPQCQVAGIAGQIFVSVSDDTTTGMAVAFAVWER